MQPLLLVAFAACVAAAICAAALLTVATTRRASSKKRRKSPEAPDVAEGKHEEPGEKEAAAGAPEPAAGDAAGSDEAKADASVFENCRHRAEISFAGADVGFRCRCEDAGAFFFARTRQQEQQQQQQLFGEPVRPGDNFLSVAALAGASYRVGFCPRFHDDRPGRCCRQLLCLQLQSSHLVLLPPPPTQATEELESTDEPPLLAVFEEEPDCGRRLVLCERLSATRTLSLRPKLLLCLGVGDTRQRAAEEVNRNRAVSSDTSSMFEESLPPDMVYNSRWLRETPIGGVASADLQTLAPSVSSQLVRNLLHRAEEFDCSGNAPAQCIAAPSTSVEDGDTNVSTISARSACSLCSGHGQDAAGAEPQTGATAKRRAASKSNRGKAKHSADKGVGSGGSSSSDSSGENSSSNNVLFLHPSQEAAGADATVVNNNVNNNDNNNDNNDNNCEDTDGSTPERGSRISSTFFSAQSGSDTAADDFA